MDTRVRYELVARYVWTGTRHGVLLERIVRLSEVWKPRQVVIDATGVGAGLAGFLRTASSRPGVSFNDWSDDATTEAVVGQSILNGVPVKLHAAA